MPQSTKKCNTSKRRGPPLQDLRMNPFTSPRQQRVNYPGLDAAFQINSSISSANLSLCSPDRSSIASPPSDLNMSIGARAAIYEHTRYVSKFGLEGELSSSSKPSTPSHSTVLGLDEWDRIMDDVPCNTSIIADSHVSTSFSNIYHHGNRSFMDGSMNRALDTTMCEEHQSDFFNTSKIIQYLATPEKNKQKVDEASRLARLGVGVMTRSGNDSICGQSHCGSTSGTDLLEQSGMIGLFHAAMKFEKECLNSKRHSNGNDEEGDDNATGDDHQDEDAGGESFVSYHEPNMSVIDLHPQSLLEEDVADHQIIQIYDDDHENGGGDENVIPDTGSTIVMDGVDAHCSFVSYQEPDLTILSGRNCEEEEIHCTSRSPSEFEQSDFHVDVSEIMAPSEFENKMELASYAARLGTLSETKRPMGHLTDDIDEGRLRHLCTSTSPKGQRVRNNSNVNASTPQSSLSRRKHNVLNDQYNAHNEVSWPSESPALRPSNRIMNTHMSLVGRHRDKVQEDDSPKVNRSLIHYFQSATGADNANVSIEYRKTHQDLDNKIGMESDTCDDCEKSLTKYTKTNSNSSKIKSPSPAAIKNQQQALQKRILVKEKERFVHNHVIPRHIGTKSQVKDIDFHETCAFDNLSPLSPPRSDRTSRSRGVNLIASSTSKSKNSIPIRMSLRERYSHRDRFQDSFTVPSHASSLGSTPRTFGDDEFGSMNKSPSPLGSFGFETAFDSPDQTGFNAHRRFAA